MCGNLPNSICGILGYTSKLKLMASSVTKGTVFCLFMIKEKICNAIPQVLSHLNLRFLLVQKLSKFGFKSKKLTLLNLDVATSLRGTLQRAHQNSCVTLSSTSKLLPLCHSIF